MLAEAIGSAAHVPALSAFAAQRSVLAFTEVGTEADRLALRRNGHTTSQLERHRRLRPFAFSCPLVPTTALFGTPRVLAPAMILATLLFSSPSFSPELGSGEFLRLAGLAVPWNLSLPPKPLPLF